MADVYWIGVFLGLGLGVGILWQACSAARARSLLVAIALAAVLGFALAIWLGGETEAPRPRHSAASSVPSPQGRSVRRDVAVPASEQPFWSLQLPSRWRGSPSYRFVGYLEFLLLTLPCRPAPPPPAGALRGASARSRTDVPGKLILVVIDGLTPEVFEQAVERGTAPTLASLHGAGSYGRRLRPSPR